MQIVLGTNVNFPSIFFHDNAHPWMEICSRIGNRLRYSQAIQLFSARTRTERHSAHQNQTHCGVHTPSKNSYQNIPSGSSAFIWIVKRGCLYALPIESIVKRSDAVQCGAVRHGVCCHVARPKRMKERNNKSITAGGKGKWYNLFKIMN